MISRFRLARLWQPRATRSVPAVAPLIPKIDVSFHIGRLVCDQSSVYVRGWAHTFERPVIALAIEVGSVRVPARLLPTPHLLEYYPEFPHLACVGFAVHVPSGPKPPMRLVVTTDIGEAVREFPLERAVAARTSTVSHAPSNVFDAFAMFTGSGGGSRFLELRSAIDHPDRNRFLALLPDRSELREYRLPTPVETETPDIATLTAAIEGCYDGIFTFGVIDRVPEPWRLIAEIHSALQFRSPTFHLVGGGYWQMSRDGLGRMFSTSTHFDTIALGDGPGPDEHWVMARRR